MFIYKKYSLYAINEIEIIDYRYIQYIQNIMRNKNSNKK